MKLRKLELQDARYMYEWMTDYNVTEHLAKDFSHMTVEDCQQFIELSKTDNHSIHLAICNNLDIYQGTISLKNIEENKEAEYAIVLRKGAIGTGIAKEATEKLLHIAFQKLNLEKVYLYVKKVNIRANKFYQKMGFQKIREDTEMNWYEIRSK